MDKKDSFSVGSFISDLDGGTLEQKIDYALRHVAKSVRAHESNKVKGEVTLKFSMQRIGEGKQLMVEHRIDSKWPTARGTKKEDDTTATPMYVNDHGALTVMPDNQLDLYGTNEGRTGESAHH